MIVSMAIAVLPVLRSPMISSRWPRPIGIMASIALMPVCSGSLTGWRSAMPGAMNSSGRRCGGVDRRPCRRAAGRAGRRRGRSAPSPTGTESSSPVRAHLVALLDPQVVAEDDGADRVLFEVEHLALRRRWRTRAARRPWRRTGRRCGRCRRRPRAPCRPRERSTSVRYLRISSSMTDAISSTLNLMKAPCLALRLGNVGVAAMDLTRGARCSASLKCVQPGRHAGVDLLVPRSATTRPPITAGSTFSISVGLRPVEAARASVSRARSASVSGTAVRTWTSTQPRRSRSAAR